MHQSFLSGRKGSKLNLTRIIVFYTEWFKKCSFELLYILKIYLNIIICNIYILDIFQITMDMDLPTTSYRLLLALYLPAMLLGTTLNLLLLITMLTNRKFRGDPRYSFILALAFSDFFLCNFTSPLTLWTTLKGHWPLGKV